MSSTIQDQIIEQLVHLPVEKQRQVLDFARSLAAARPVGVPGHTLLRFAGAIPPDDLAKMTRAIEEGCEATNPEGPERRELPSGEGRRFGRRRFPAFKLGALMLAIALLAPALAHFIQNRKTEERWAQLQQENIKIKFKQELDRYTQEVEKIRKEVEEQRREYEQKENKSDPNIINI